MSFKNKNSEIEQFVVTGIEIGPFMVLQDVENIITMVNIIVDLYGHPLKIGAGFSLEERNEYTRSPEKLVGKTVFIQYWEKTYHRDGTPSLRFPIFAGICNKD